MPSVSRSVSAAYDHMVRILFAPFDLGKWFVMGFCAFLAGLGGGSFRFANLPNRRGPHAPGIETFSGGLAWVQQHLALVIATAILVLLCAAAIGLLLAWISARGEFMLLDGIVRNRGEVAEPWKRFRKAGNGLLLYRIRVTVVALLFLLVMVVIGMILVLPMIRQGGGNAVLKPLILLAFPTCVGLFAYAIYVMVLRDFGVPIMYRAEVSPHRAMGIFRTEFLPGHIGAFILFYLMKLLLGIASFVLFIMAGCLTCCIGFLPYLSSVLMLPVTVFFRCYALDLMAQIHPEWDLLQSSSM